MSQQVVFLLLLALLLLLFCCCCCFCCITKELIPKRWAFHGQCISGTYLTFYQRPFRHFFREPLRTSTPFYTIWACVQLYKKNIVSWFSTDKINTNLFIHDGTFSKAGGVVCVSRCTCNEYLMLKGERCPGVFSACFLIIARYRKVQNTPIFKLTDRYLLIRI